MTVLSYKNVLERPRLAYADVGSILIPTGESDQLNLHKANSACCYFVCTLDSSRNKLYEFIGENCVIELLNNFKIIADDCIEEIKQ